MKRLIANLMRRTGLEQFSVLWGYFRASGWRKSMLSKQAIDFNGRPIPWYSYAFIHFISERLHALRGKTGINVFEFGSGNSTLWWADKAGNVVSVEDDPIWHNYVSKNKPSNVTYKLAVDAEHYLNALYACDQVFDVIIIDGNHREQCIRAGVDKLSDTGVLILDNSDWVSMSQSIEWLRSIGFRQLEFFSVGPINGHPWGTSVFYRQNNVLRI